MLETFLMEQKKIDIIFYHSFHNLKTSLSNLSTTKNRVIIAQTICFIGVTQEMVRTAEEEGKLRNKLRVQNESFDDGWTIGIERLIRWKKVGVRTLVRMWVYRLEVHGYMVGLRNMSKR